MLKSLRPLFPYLKKYRVGYVFAVISVLLNNGIWILWPQVIRRAADDLEHKSPEAFDRMGRAIDGIAAHFIGGPPSLHLRETMIVFAAMILAIAAAKGIFQFLTR